MLSVSCPQAAVLYERAGLWEKAAAIYIQIKAFAQAARIMGQVTLPKLHSQYAKVRQHKAPIRLPLHAFRRTYILVEVGD